jgi:hypothetical protein
MLPRLRQWLSDPLVLLALVAALSTAVIQSGELGSADTMHRLQTTHSFWTREPQVFPNEYPEFGLHGRGGKLYSWYGMGQSLLMLPADIMGTALGDLPIFAEYDDTDPTVRDIFVSFSTNILISVLTALVAYWFLIQLLFTQRQAVAGVLALLFATSHLHYAQNMMENNFIFLLTLAGFAFHYQWLRRDSDQALLIGCAAFGLNLLTRLTTALDLLAGGVFLLLVLWMEHVRGRALWHRFVSYTEVAAPVYAFFILVDRIYQHHRFGSYFNTYVTIFAQEYHKLNPALPPNYPWETPFRVGFLGPLLTPEKSIFLFDPLLVLTILVAAFGWKRFRAEVKAYLISAFLLLLGYICFYAKYTVWSGDFAWGDRYVSTSVELVAFISVPLLMKHRTEIKQWLWAVGAALIAVSTAVQLASLAFWLPLEIYQMETFGHPTWVIALRCKNIVAFALGKMDAWNLNTPAMTEDPWDYVHITTWNFLPFLLRRVGEAPTWAVNTVQAAWTATLAALTWALWRLRQSLAG